MTLSNTLTHSPVLKDHGGSTRLVPGGPGGRRFSPSDFYAPEGTIDDGYHVSVLQLHGLVDNRSVHLCWIRGTEIKQRCLRVENKKAGGYVISR